MKEIRGKVIKFIKKEIVLSVAVVLACISMFICPPSKGYVDYIDVRTLVILFCLMAVVAGLQSIGVFDYIAVKLLAKIGSTRGLVAILVFLCFFASMFITNDVSLITFVPFTILIMSKSGNEHLIVYTVVLQTIAANIGSILMPFGSPHNLYLYEKAGMGLGEFVKFMLPLWIISFVIMCVCVFFVKKENAKAYDSKMVSIESKFKTIVYAMLFVACILTVVKILPHFYLFGIILLVVLVMDYKVLMKVDYLLLLTFTSLFIFIGNIKSIDYVSEFLRKVIKGNELIVGILSSQVISNVPTSILLSGFTDKIDTLVIATNIGGLGTLIASMASLISYKLYGKFEKCDMKKYFKVFTGMNVLCLVIMWAFAFFVY